MVQPEISLQTRQDRQTKKGLRVERCATVNFCLHPNLIVATQCTIIIWCELAAR